MKFVPVRNRTDPLVTAWGYASNLVSLHRVLFQQEGRKTLPHVASVADLDVSVYVGRRAYLLKAESESSKNKGGAHAIESA